MTYGETAWLGCFAVVGASAFMVLRPAWFFGRKLSLEEALSVCWVGWSIYMGAFVIYIGLIPLGLSRDAHAPAVCVAVCFSVLAVLVLARLHYRLEERGDQINFWSVWFHSCSGSPHCDPSSLEMKTRRATKPVHFR